MREHPLTQLVELYCDEYPALREKYLDLPSLQFHRDFGLLVKAPETWPVYKAIEVAVNKFTNTIIIYSAASSYRDLYEKFGDDVKYFSWHEVYTGMMIARSDVRSVHRIKGLLAEARLTIFLDPPNALPEVIDQVRGFSNGCLMVLSMGDRE